MKKIPCIKCSSEMFEYIKPYLISWSYTIRVSQNWYKYPLLIINESGAVGICNNYEISFSTQYDRELVTNVEEFLERAAELKGFTYKRKDIMKTNEIEIKPGMVLEGVNASGDQVILVVIPTDSGPHFMSADGKFVSDYRTVIKHLTCIRGRSKGGILRNGDVLWREKVTLTIQQIADKFGVHAESLVIVA